MEIKEKINSEELSDRLSDFKSSEQTYLHRISDNWNLRLSEGCFFVREAADAYWLFDLILSYQSSSALIGVNMQSWSIRKVQKGRLQIVCRDRKGDVLIGKVMKQRFSLDDLTIIVMGNYARLKSEFLHG